MVRAQAMRKQRGAWYTPGGLVDLVVTRVLDDLDSTGDLERWAAERPVRILDPACGDGRFLAELGRRLRSRGHDVDAIGCDIDADALTGVGDARTVHADALTHDWGDERFDIVIGNPPFLSQMAAATTRGRSSRHGGGPYADAAAEFLALTIRLARPDGGRVALVLPQSILASRDAGPVRELVDASAERVWSYWEPDQRHFDASVNICALGLRRPARTSPADPLDWTGVITDRLGIPRLDLAGLDRDGTVGDRATLNANFRDEYYALVPAVDDQCDGPPLVTSGLIDPGVCHWGDRPVRFAKRTFRHPRVDVGLLPGRFPAWARAKLVPKVLVANQTRVIEAVADPAGAWIPGVPVTTVVPHDGTARSVSAIEAVLTSPIASAVCWHLGAGTGLSTTSVRVGPASLAAVPWPAGDLMAAVGALGDGDTVGCGAATLDAYGVAPDAAESLLSWWAKRLPA